ncbi:MAG: histidinol-phosphate transaminase [Lachnospiraceae bacterium]|nr:histidinol-phosphate transaminase [Lachnospiraceae bacterium]
MEHGGDIYRNRISYDFSVNINPLGMPDGVKKALHRAVKSSTQYPDIQSEQLINVLAAYLNCDPSWILCGNGASELFTAIMHARISKRIADRSVIDRSVVDTKWILDPMPSFAGYLSAAQSIGAQVIPYFLSSDHDFELEQDICNVLTKDVDMLFLANPNNPTGKLINPTVLEYILKHCLEKNILVVLDECFIELAGAEKQSMKSQLEKYPNLIIVRAFTKTFGIPGVRLGYLLCSEPSVRKAIKEQLPEWNLSVFAQTAGVAACREETFLRESISMIQKEREYLKMQLERLDMKVFPSDANFLLFQSGLSLYDLLLKEQILIRDCSDFMGLEKGYYRVAVKTRIENEQLIRCLERIK